MYRLALGLAVMAYPVVCCPAIQRASSFEGPTLSGEVSSLATCWALETAEAGRAPFFTFGTAAR